MYTISEVSQKMNIPASTIRYYDKEGLLPFITRKKTGYRLFSENDIEMLKLIECLKNTGMSIKEIKHWIELVKMGDDSLEERYQFFINHKQSILNQIQQLNDQMALIEHKVWYYKTAIEAGTETIHQNSHSKTINQR